MAFVASDADALEAAIKAGVKTVKYADREVTYASMDEMLRARQVIKTEVAQAGGSKTISYMQFDRD